MQSFSLLSSSPIIRCQVMQHERWRSLNCTRTARRMVHIYVTLENMADSQDNNSIGQRVDGGRRNLENVDILSGNK